MQNSVYFNANDLQNMELTVHYYYIVFYYLSFYYLSYISLHISIILS